MLEFAKFFATLANGVHEDPLLKIQSDGRQATNMAMPLSTIPQ
jgi:hypothetical protein